MHRILERQIKRVFGEHGTLSPQWTTLLTLVSDTYTHFDDDRALLNRSLDMSSKEFLENNRRLEVTRQEVEEQAKNLALQVAKRTEELNERVSELEDARKAMTNLLEDFGQEQKALAEAKAKVEALLGSIADGCIAVDQEGKIILINQMAEKMLGYTNSEAIGKPWHEILHREDEQGNPLSPELGAIRAALSETTNGTKKSAVAPSQTSSGNYYYVRRDNTRFPVAITVAPVLLKNKVVGAIEILRDITKEKEIDRAKTEFVIVASHALRTPLTAIDGLVSMILDGEYGPVSNNFRQPLEDVNTSSERLIQLVNDLLSLSRIQSGKMKYTFSDVSIADVITETVHLLQPLADKKGLQLAVTALEPDVVQSDQDKLKEVLNDLIGNAIKFTDKGTITVATCIADEKLEVRVTDTGVGISKEDQQRLFSLFQQLKSCPGRPVGTGFGLYISKEIIAHMGGALWLEQSDVGVGSTFAFSVPLAKSSIAMKIREEAEKDVEVYHILK